MDNTKDITLYKKYCKNTDHACEVEKYCEKLLDALKEGTEKYKNISEREKIYLKTAALLHDIGYVVDKKSHHKHAMKLIIDEGIEGFDEEEVLVTANIARYHRGALPDVNKHEIFAQLPAEKQRLVGLLASILRIADGLDKPHKNLILRMKAINTPDSVDLYLKTVGFKPNLKMAEIKKNMLEDTLNKKINFLFM